MADKVIEHTEELGQPEMVSAETVNLESEAASRNMLSDETSDLPEPAAGGIFGGNIVAIMTGGALWNR
jgi:hypothetical protein